MRFGLLTDTQEGPMMRRFSRTASKGLWPMPSTATNRSPAMPQQACRRQLPHCAAYQKMDGMSLTDGKVLHVCFSAAQKRLSVFSVAQKQTM